ncbi:hypothetical protein [Xanthomonas sp. GPE 39]|uniref:hypothetical protein n=1 Tax=Xanthomonas sp. GPE 39 TaxID=1583099 RepID=UPI000A521D6A|nr:hypothetical protein [Xanthomonas sp. GPE 39]
MHRLLLAHLALLLSTNALADATPSATPPATMAVATANGMATNQLPIRSQAQLDAYLRTHAGEPTPLDALTPGARERFIDGLVFGRNGLVGFDPQDLPQLTREQGHALLALFGAEQYADTLTNWAKHARAADTTATISALERRYNGYNHLLRQRQAEGQDHWPSLRAALPEAFDRRAAAQLDNASLTLLYRAIVATYVARPTPAGLQAQLHTLELLRDRGQADAAQLDAAGNALLLAHRTEDARRLLANGGSADWPHWLHFDDRLGPGAHGPTLWSLDTDGTTLRRQRIDLRTPQILITAGCHISDDAARAIADDPELGPAFHRHALWLSNPPGTEDMSLVRNWNQRHPQMPLHPIYAAAEWPLLPHPWAMPTFFLVRDGRVQAQLKGSPADDQAQRRALKRMLQDAGLLP